MPSISFQMFSTRNWPVEETFAMLSELGIREVEGFGPLFEDPAATRALMDQYGLSMPTAHFGFDLVESDPAKVIDIANTLGAHTVIVPYLMPDDRPTDRAGWQAFAARLAEAGKPIVAAGLTYGWHNHDFEFLPTADGCLPIEEIAAASDDIMFELDLAWIHVAGQDPVDWLNRYKGRVVVAHVKDRAAAGDNADEDGWADLGHGVIDYSRIVPALKETGVTRWVLEHDNPSDQQRFASRSFETVSKF